MTEQMHFTFMERAAAILNLDDGKRFRAGKAQSKKVSEARYACAHVMRERLRWSYPRIARTLGFRNHTSALYAHRQSRELVNDDPAHAQMVAQLEHVA